LKTFGLPHKINPALGEALGDKIYNNCVFGANALCPGRDKMLVEKHNRLHPVPVSLGTEYEKNKSHSVPDGTGTGSEGAVFSTNILSLTGQRAMFLPNKGERRGKNTKIIRNEGL
jgi:hypothetical protein